MEEMSQDCRDSALRQILMNKQKEKIYEITHCLMQAETLTDGASSF